jgi:thioredoxin 1
MKTYLKVLTVAALAVAVLVIVVLKDRQAPAEVKQAGTVRSQSAARLPKMIDLGADKCIPCKMMAPILANLKKEYAGKFEVEFIDVWKNPSAGQIYGIEIIPTQIFFDASGKELFRHTGFYGREDILGKWKELGLDMGSPKEEAKIRMTDWTPDGLVVAIAVNS